MRQLAGIRMTTPGAFERGNGTSFRNCCAFCRLQRVKDLARLDHDFQQGKYSVARWTGISSDSSRSPFLASANF